MLNVNAHKNFTVCDDKEAEELLGKVLLEIGDTLSGTPLCVYLGGSYGRGDGGVRQDKNNGILYNDLDFFVFARKRYCDAASLLKEIAEKYEKELKIDVDFSKVMSVNDIKNNATRLMMQELKRGYHRVCGEDLLEKYLPEIPAEKLPYSEACRLLLNRGMGLLLAGEKITGNSTEIDFILRNLNKAILGACDAFLIAEKKYKWSITGRLAEINNSELSVECKKLYTRAVEFKKSPNRDVVPDLNSYWIAVRDIFRECMEHICGNNCSEIYLPCRQSGEISLKNLIKYCIKSRRVPVTELKNHTLPAVAVILPQLYSALKKMPEKIDLKSKLYQHWLMFN